MQWSRRLCRMLKIYIETNEHKCETIKNVFICLLYRINVHSKHENISAVSNVITTQAIKRQVNTPYHKWLFDVYLLHPIAFEWQMIIPTYVDIFQFGRPFFLLLITFVSRFSPNPKPFDFDLILKCSTRCILNRKNRRLLLVFTHMQSQ